MREGARRRRRRSKRRRRHSGGETKRKPPSSSCGAMGGAEFARERRAFCSLFSGAGLFAVLFDDALTRGLVRGTAAERSREARVLGDSDEANNEISD